MLGFTRYVACAPRLGAAVIHVGGEDVDSDALGRLLVYNNVFTMSVGVLCGNFAALTYTSYTDTCIL